MNKEEKNLGKILLKARNEKGLSQDALSKKLHISRQSISNWENNINIPDLDTLEKICKILNLDFDDVCILATSYPNKKKKKKINIFLLMFLIITVIIIVFIITLVKYRNEFIVYNIQFESNDLYTSNGIFINSNVNNYFQLGNLQLKNDNIHNYKVRLYYKNEGDIRLLIESKYNDNIILNEEYGYGEYFDETFDINNVYIDLISMMDEESVKTYKVQFIKLFENENLFNFKEKRVIAENAVNRNIQNSNITEEVLVANNYEYKDNNYVKKTKNGFFQYDVYNNILYFYNDFVYLKNDVDDNIISGRAYDLKLQEYTINFNYDSKNNEVTCFSDNCNNYENYIDLLNYELDLLLK